MATLLTVCTGNICRSPIAAMLLESQLSTEGLTVASAGTHPQEGAMMPRPAQAVAHRLGISSATYKRHRARMLRTADVDAAALILAMSRDHRRFIADIRPSARSKTFTIREFARLTRDLSEQDLRVLSRNTKEADLAERLSELAGLVASQRGKAHPPKAPGDDDIVDPYRKSRFVYRRSGTQLEDAARQTSLAIRTVLTT
ncbi:MAG TPA: low molecular weight phosphatase family protein [Actinomycetota bacterium]|jgi:protein-tyrosine phosphatase|nr:low molecular weight phosphatase family protein [Actinomycetota bacterium]